MRMRIRIRIRKRRDKGGCGNLKALLKASRREAATAAVVKWLLEEQRAIRRNFEPLLLKATREWQSAWK